jgi:uncharacterized membrane protein
MRFVPAINLLAGIAIASISVPLIKGRVAPNRSYGIRIPVAFTSEENWYRVNRFGGRIFFRVGIYVGIIGLLGLFVPTAWLIGYASLSALLVVGGVVIGALYIVARAGKAR